MTCIFPHNISQLPVILSQCFFCCTFIVFLLYVVFSNINDSTLRLEELQDCRSCPFSISPVIWLTRHTDIRLIDLENLEDWRKWWNSIKPPVNWGWLMTCCWFYGHCNYNWNQRDSPHVREQGKNTRHKGSDWHIWSTLMWGVQTVNAERYIMIKIS